MDGVITLTFDEPMQQTGGMVYQQFEAFNYEGGMTQPDSISWKSQTELELPFTGYSDYSDPLKLSYVNQSPVAIQLVSGKSLPLFSDLNVVLP